MSLKGRKMTERKDEKKERELEKTKVEREKGRERTRKKAIFRYFLYFILLFL
jgi:hypothetical protein